MLAHARAALTVGLLFSVGLGVGAAWKQGRLPISIEPAPSGELRAQVDLDALDAASRATQSPASPAPEFTPPATEVVKNLVVAENGGRVPARPPGGHTAPLLAAESRAPLLPDADTSVATEAASLADVPPGRLDSAPHAAFAEPGATAALGIDRFQRSRAPAIGGSRLPAVAPRAERPRDDELVANEFASQFAAQSRFQRSRTPSSSAAAVLTESESEGVQPVNFEVPASESAETATTSDPSTAGPSTPGESIADPSTVDPSTSDPSIMAPTPAASAARNRVAAVPGRSVTPENAGAAAGASSSEGAPADGSDSPRTFDEKLLAARAISTVDSPIPALKAYSQLYWNYPDRRSEFQQTLDDLAQRVFFQTQPHILEPYVVQPGDRLQSIASKYKVSWQYLSRLNQTDPKRLRANQRLKVIRGPFAARVELSRFVLTVHLQGYYVKQYAVGIGKEGSSPVGQRSVLNKVENPQYTDPEGRVLEGDDPQNPLGERWVDLGDSYGIHGTIEPDSIGTAASRGCIRMLDRDVIEVYDFLVTGSEVVLAK